MERHCARPVSVYTKTLLIVWDEQKRLSNIDKHGLDFADLDDVFFFNAEVVPARQGRFKAVGHLFGAIVTVIFIQLGTEAWSVISLRPANPKERRMIE